ncbi:UDP-glycosyltransferase 79B9 [Vitis vinifera]|uniref:UDP-glycosyltransferase 79B9 n=1 Tax=Vitis vinifera TaxID=29760 RepID=A0A438C4A4_VITVI|nr:UDP-glycosyltransferase 79B9 [Vitis vinifera]
MAMAMARSNKIAYSIVPMAQSQLQHLNLHPTLITFHPLTIPHVDGLPPGAETASDVPFFMHHLLVTAMDRTADQVEAALRIKSIYYSAVCAAALVRHPVPGGQVGKDRPITAGPPRGYPSSTVVLRPHEAWMEQLPPVLPKPLPTPSEDRWAQWLSGFKPGSVIFCAFGSQNFPEKDQFKNYSWATVALDQCGESLTSDPQNSAGTRKLLDQILNTRLLAEVLKVAVEIEKEENGLVFKGELVQNRQISDG